METLELIESAKKEIGTDYSWVKLTLLAWSTNICFCGVLLSTEAKLSRVNDKHLLHDPCFSKLLNIKMKIQMIWSNKCIASHADARDKAQDKSAWEATKCIPVSIILPKQSIIWDEPLHLIRKCIVMFITTISKLDLKMWSQDLSAILHYHKPLNLRH